MKAIFIDSTKRTVSRIDFKGNYKDIQQKIGCYTFDVASIPDCSDGIYVDDNGLFLCDTYFYFPGMVTPLAGNGLILGTDESGESTDSDLYDDFDVESVSFFTKSELAVLLSMGFF